MIKNNETNNFSKCDQLKTDNRKGNMEIKREQKKNTTPNAYSTYAFFRY